MRVPFKVPFKLGAEGELSTFGFPSPALNDPFGYYSYDFLTGRFNGRIPMRGVKFGQQLNNPGKLTGTIDLQDPRVQLTNPIGATAPNHTLIAVDFNGGIIWAGMVITRDWTVDTSTQDTQRTLEIAATEIWSYFGSRVQATDYSAPPFSGITGSSPMALWTGTPWDASLIACQIIEDAIGYSNRAISPYGNPLGGLGVLLNGRTPSGASPAAPSANWIPVNYPFTSLQLVDSIVTQLSQLGLGVGFDFGVDVAYESGPGSKPVATVNISYPRRGRTFAESQLLIDLATARKYRFPEDGSQTANTIYEVGGGGGLVVDENVVPLEQGYPTLERVISRSSIQSANILNLLGQIGTSDLALYSYAPVAPTVTVSAFDPNLPFGSFTVGDDILLKIPAQAPDGTPFDPRFPAGLEQEWRVVQWEATITDTGDAVIDLTLNAPPFVQAIAPAV